MPNHAPLAGNRFSVLADTSKTPTKKRRQNITEEIFPKLPPVSVQSRDPKFVLIKSGDESNSLSKLSVFAKKKYIDGISLETESISMLRDGSLLVLTKSQTIADKFLKVKKFGESCPVVVTLHAKLNSCQGIIYDRNMIDVPEEEILADLKDQGVSDIYKFSKVVNNIKMYTGAILITFNLFKLPSSLNVAWYKVQIKEFFPNPMRCKNCQQLGHTIKHCRNNAACNYCNSPPHNPDQCKRDQCANCHGPHPASAADCPKYIQLKDILKIQTKNKCTIYDARKIYFLNNPPKFQPANSSSIPSTSYASAVSNAVIINSKNDPTNNNNTPATEKTNLNISKKVQLNTSNSIKSNENSNSHLEAQKPVSTPNNNNNNISITHSNSRTKEILITNNTSNQQTNSLDTNKIILEQTLTDSNNLSTELSASVARQLSPSMFSSSDSDIDSNMS